MSPALAGVPSAPSLRRFLSSQEISCFLSCLSICAVSGVFRVSLHGGLSDPFSTSLCGAFWCLWASPSLTHPVTPPQGLSGPRAPHCRPLGP